MLEVCGEDAGLPGGRFQILATGKEWKGSLQH